MGNTVIPSEQSLAYLHGYILGLCHRAENDVNLFDALCDLESMFCHTMGLPSKLVEWKIVPPGEMGEDGQ